ncbi:phosphoglucosamine mutase [Demequina sp. SYSU T00039]|uniref:Phosphoglucosamine mutase n=1 Tax=Demequina lignilytica TaxID=3051663 RepID=A0AAW7M4P1_9MICO|nr:MULTISPECIES: phosphoglucosamine mutase [unclassified Demequina]MDN4478140.1 phosphoglucosamine mutase [Demequina sp. SYSU T00039-1]MDN4488410.1 phosphoglucosamine mutase [Demequina sp. SYSU T00039]MDN4490043.1 phosphoglucosamine mutase [Demequina sp. SYSU T00068]
MARLFGTDGVRGLANRDLTAELAVDLSVAAAHILGERGEFSGHRPVAVLGRDTRLSGEFLGAAVAAGLASAGVDVLDAGVLPTPAVAYLTAATGADLGVVISASHNPMPDNGIKFFARGGHKLDDSVEEAIERRLGEPWERPTGDAVGRIVASPQLAAQYVEHVDAAVRAFAGTDAPLAGVHLVVDAAHGAASAVGPLALANAGARVTTINASPDGLNINDGVGSTHLEQLQAAVVEAGADLGVAFDGDADRCLAVDHTGAVVNGDQIMGLLAIAMKEAGALYRSTLVATVMSNLGLHQAMRRAGVDIVETAVGDRYVLEAMREGGYSLGGEQSGHVIVAEHATTGDGILTALLLGARVAAAGPLRDQCAGIETLPQVLINVPNADRSRVHTDVELQAAVAASRKALGDAGRVLLRPSGTEPLVRVMVEAATAEDAQRHASSLATVVAARLGL